MRPYEDGAGEHSSKVFAPRHQFGRYQIIQVLGSGAFAAVYEAHDPALDATVAVKVLGDHHCGDADIRSRFINEARLLRRGVGDRLVPVYDIGEEGGQPFFVMELLPLGTLGDRLEALGRPVSFEAARRVADELGGCLNALHSAGIVHRDLKPSNLLLRNTAAVPVPASPSHLLAPTERLVLGDFGIARDADASNLTMAGGTIGYMAPEQYTTSADIDHRADIFAASAILTAVLTGRLQPPHPNDLPAVVPESIRAALGSGMAHLPAERPQSAQAWHQMMMTAIPNSNESIPSQMPTSAPYPSTGGSSIPAPRGGQAAASQAPGAQGAATAPFEAPVPGATAPFGAPVPGDTRPLQGAMTPPGPMTPGPMTPGQNVAQNGPEASGSSSSFGLPVIAGGVVAALLALGALFFGYSALNSGPEIIGPETLTVSETATYQPAEIKPEATYSWIDWEGNAIDVTALEVTAQGLPAGQTSGILPITLVETTEDGESSEKLDIKVVAATDDES